MGQTRPFTDPLARAENIPIEPGTLQAGDIRQELGRIVASEVFRHSLRLTRFLTVVVEATLAGKANRLKAYTIAIEALGRGSDFDPQADPIVRVEAGRLRQALTRYYSGAGRNSPMVIDMPRGAYVPIFRPRDEEGAASSDSHLAAVPPRREALATYGGEDLLSPALRHLALLCEIIPGLVGQVRMTRDARHAETRPQAQASDAIGWVADGDKSEDAEPSVAGDPLTTTAIPLIVMLDELSARLLASPDLTSAAEAILDAAIHLHRPDFGHVQVLDKRTNQLVIHAQHGFSRKFLETFKRVSAHDSCASARALRDRAPVIVEDVLSDAKYAAFRDIAAETGYRAVQSMPLIASNGMVVGAASTVFARPHVPSRLEMLMMKLYARLAADTVARFAA